LGVSRILGEFFDLIGFAGQIAKKLQ
jgi:hypothetical protein